MNRGTILGVTGLLAVFFIAERFVPLRRRRAGLMLRLAVNAGLSTLALATALVSVQPAVSSTLTWTSRSSFGLVPRVPGPEWVRFVLGFLLLDLSFYYWHVLNHRLPLLWRFHNVHHIDPDLDVSTGFRFHAGEVLLSTAFRVVQIAVTGTSLATFVIYEFAFQANTLFHHSNVRLPIRLERLLNTVLVTPRMHGVHHSQVRDETNSNFGVVFRWWDPLHRTLQLDVPQSNITIGVAGYSRPQDNRFWHTLVLPFLPQRDYWRRDDGSIPERGATARTARRHRLAE
jgi:sterol desaturase/sphingolipid hydroxylase (fatty acid hydroxylase superfamily)